MSNACRQYEHCTAPCRRPCRRPCPDLAAGEAGLCPGAAWVSRADEPEQHRPGSKHILLAPACGPDLRLSPTPGTHIVGAARLPQPRVLGRALRAHLRVTGHLGCGVPIRAMPLHRQSICILDDGVDGDVSRVRSEYGGHTHQASRS